MKVYLSIKEMDLILEAIEMLNQDYKHNFPMSKILNKLEEKILTKLCKKGVKK